MYQVTFTSLIAPETKQAGMTMVRRAGTCLAEKMAGSSSGGASPILDYNPTDGRVTVSSESLDALLALPMSIGSPVGHFGQFERSASMMYISDRRYAAVYRLRTAFAITKEDTKNRLVRQVGARLSAYLESGMSDFGVCPNEARGEIVVYFGNADQASFLPEQFNAVFFRSAIIDLIKAA